MRKLKISRDTTIPVVVDSPMEHIVRCTYFSIECFTPSPGWSLEAEGIKIPYIMLGLQGIVHRPMSGGGLFTSQGQLDRLFDAVDSLEEFFVDTNAVWFVSDAMPKAERGEVYRVPLELFTFGRKLPSLDLKTIKNETPKTMAVYSKKEHDVFSRWAKRQISDARQYYWQKNSEGMTLRPKGGK